MSGPADLLEPGAMVSKIEHGAITKDAAVASIAISLKRIADGLDGAPELIRLAVYNGITEGLFSASQRQ